MGKMINSITDVEINSVRPTCHKPMLVAGNSGSQINCPRATNLLNMLVHGSLFNSIIRKKTAFLIVIITFLIRLFLNFDSSLFVSIIVIISVLDYFISSYFEP